MHGPSGDFVGADSMGNRYYESKTADLGECLAIIPSTVKQAKTFYSNHSNSQLNSGQVFSLLFHLYLSEVQTIRRLDCS